MNSYVNENSTCYLPCAFHCAKSLAYELWARSGCDFARLFGCADTVVVVVVVFVSLWAAESDLIAGRAVSRACTPCPHSLRLTHSVSLSFSLPSLPLVLYCILLAWPGQKVCALSEQCSVQIVTLTRAFARLKLNLDFAFIFRSTTTTATTTAETGKQRNCLRAKKDK